jgi:hypothetical protein
MIITMGILFAGPLTGGALAGLVYKGFLWPKG